MQFTDKSKLSVNSTAKNHQETEISIWEAVKYFGCMFGAILFTVLADQSQYASCISQDNSGTQTSSVTLLSTSEEQTTSSQMHCHEIKDVLDSNNMKYPWAMKTSIFERDKRLKITKQTLILVMYLKKLVVLQTVTKRALSSQQLFCGPTYRTGKQALAICHI